jgi:hypothetical protein
MNITNTIVTYPDGGSTKYWVGGSGDWNDTLHWSDTSGGEGGATIPSYSNTVIVDDSSIVFAKDEEGNPIEETLTITWEYSSIVYCEFLTTTITTPCVFDSIAQINVTDGVNLSDTTSIVDTIYVSNIDTIVYWTLVDGTWTYMNIYYYTEAEWNNTTPADLQNRQVTQYVAWREYCNDPVTTMPEITSTRIEGSI